MLKQLLISFSLFFFSIVTVLAQNFGIGTATPGSKLSVNGNLSVGATYSGNAAPANGAIIEGNVGIGTSSPSQKLHVAGNMRLTGALYDVNNQAGTAGQVLTTTGTGIDWVDPASLSDGDWVVSGTNMYSGVSGNVGIGTATPAGKLDVDGALYVGTEGIYDRDDGTVDVREDLAVHGGDINTGGAATDLRITATTDYYIDLRPNDPTYGVIIRRNGVATDWANLEVEDTYFGISKNSSGAHIAITDAGNVGIGTTTPAVKLHINGDVRGNQGGALRINTGNGYVDVGPKNTTWCHFYTDRARYYFDKGISVDQGLVGSYNQDLQLQTSGTTRITVLNSNGDVGIGTSSPTAKLDVYTTYSNTYNAASPGYLQASINIFDDNPTTTALTYQYAALGFHVRSKYLSNNAYAYIALVQKDTYSNFGDLTFVLRQSNGDPPLERMRITSAGNVGIGTSSPNYQLELSQNSAAKPTSSTWTIASDERLKNITGSYTKGLKEIIRLKPIRYFYKKEFHDKIQFANEVYQTEAVGFAAQAVAKVFPEAVDTMHNGFLSLDLHPVLVAQINALKELYEQNKNLQAQLLKKSQEIEVVKKSAKQEIEALRKRIAKLEAQITQLLNS